MNEYKSTAEWEQKVSYARAQLNASYNFPYRGDVEYGKLTNELAIEFMTGQRIVTRRGYIL